MGLLDQFKAYIDANTPRNTRPAVSPQNVIYAGLLQKPVENIKANAAGLLGEMQRAPQDLAALASPQMYAKALKAMNTPQPVDKQKWLDAGMELSGMAPVGWLLGMTKAAIPLTEYEIAHQVAQRNAADMLGLPPNNTAMDRAMAMGFDTPAYHGTTDDFVAFDKAKRGSSTDNGWYGPGEYSSPHPSAADAYTMSKWPEYKPGANIMPVILKNPESIENKFGNVTEYVTREPNQIRSRFAAFDPSKRESADLLAGLAPYVGIGGLISLGLLSPEEAYAK